MGMKKVFKKRAIVLSALFTAGMFSLSVYSYLSLAWFSSNRVATVSFSSVKVGAGYEMEIYSFNENRHLISGSTYSYNGYGYGSRSNISANVTSFATDFYLPTSTSEFNTSFLNTNIAVTYCLKITNNSGSASTPHVYLTSFASPNSASNFSDSDSHLISLAENMAVYSGFSLGGASFKSDFQAFLTGAMSDSTTDRFTHNYQETLADADDWSASSATDIPVDGTGYYFLTFRSLDDSSTYYSLSEGTFTDGYTHYTRNTAGDSNAFMYSSTNQLSISFTGISVLPY